MKKEKPNTSITQQAHSLVKISTVVKTVYITNELVFIRHTYEDNIKMLLKAIWRGSGDYVHFTLDTEWSWVLDNTVMNLHVL
jgi:hypothetical protein